MKILKVIFFEDYLRSTPFLSDEVRIRSMYTAAPPALEKWLLEPDLQEKAKQYQRFLKKWNVKINLVQNKTLDCFWDRHFIDSAQLILYLPTRDCPVVDLGSGAGFPGMVLALLGCPRVTLVDKSIKKTTFLKQLAQNLKVDVQVLCQGTETLSPASYDVVVARAFTGLTHLLVIFQNVSRETSIGLFLKGERILQEIKTAEETWDFSYTLFDSLTHQKSKIIKVWDVKKRESKNQS